MSTQADPNANAGKDAGDPAPPQAPTAFQMLCGSLGAQVQMALGLIADPVDKKVRTELDAARHGIGMLEMLSEKTKGNLDERESKLLDTMLAQLRMLYVGRAKQVEDEKAAEGTDETSPGEKQ